MTVACVALAVAVAIAVVGFRLAPGVGAARLAAGPRPPHRGRPVAWAAGRRRAVAAGDVDVARWCERVAAGVRAGRSLSQAVTEADAATPHGRRPFGDVSHALSRGQALTDAVADADTGPEQPAGLLAPVVVALAELGGSAARPLERVAATLHARAAERDERKAASAQARLSARVLTVLPFAVLAVLVLAERSVRTVLVTPAGAACLVLGSIANAVGWWWMRHLVGRVA